MQFTAASLIRDAVPMHDVAAGLRFVRSTVTGRGFVTYYPGEPEPIGFSPAG